MSKTTYKIVYWINNDLQNDKFVNKEDVLVIGTGNRHLTWQELTLTEEQMSKIDSNTQFIFDSHGGTEQASECRYTIATPEGDLKDYGLVSVINEIFKSSIATQGVNLHMMSCHVGAGYEALAAETIRQVTNSNWLGNAIFLHGGSDTIRGYRANKVLDIIDEAILSSGNVTQNSFNLFEKFYVHTPGDMSLIQAPGFPENKPLFLATKFVGHSLKDISNYISGQWHECFKAISDFSRQNNIEIQLKDTVTTDPFNYLKECLLGGADAFYGLQFHVAIGALDGTLAPDDSANIDNVNRFIEDLYSLVEGNQITKQQYDELIAIQFVYRAVKVHVSKGFLFPQGFGFKLSTAHEKLFQKGIDLTKTMFSGYPLLLQIINDNYAPLVNSILNMEGISCSDLNIKTHSGYPLVHWLFTHDNAQTLLPLVLAKTTVPIDLNVLVDGFPLIYSLFTHDNAQTLLPFFLSKTTAPVDLKNNCGSGILIEYLKYNKDFKANIKLLLEKSLPLTQEDFSQYIAPYIDNETITQQVEEVELIGSPE